MTPIDLTPGQIKEIDEVQADKKAHEITLRVALNFHANVLNKVNKRETQFWEDLIKTHTLDPKLVYTIVNGQVVVQEK